MPDPTSVIQSVYAAFGRGDIPALLALLADDVAWTFHGDHGAPFSGRFSGKAQVAEWFGEVARAEDIQSFEPREFLAGADHVTVVGHERVIARPGGGMFETEWVHVWRLRDGRVASFLGIYDSQAAAAARAPR